MVFALAAPVLAAFGLAGVAPERAVAQVRAQASAPVGAQTGAPAPERPAMLLYAPLPRPDGQDRYGFEAPLPTDAARPTDAAGPTSAPRAAVAEDATGAGDAAWAEDAALARLFVQLHFDLERGAPRRASAAWATPVTIAPDAALEAYRPFLERYVAALRERAGAPVVLAAGSPDGASAAPTPGVLHVRAAPAVDMRRWLGPALCVVFPGDWRWADLAEALGRDDPPRWSEATELSRATVFIPDRTPPWLARACLMEEIAQAFGPAGDFFWLTDSIFNDDNVRLSPGPLDFFMIRLAFTPEFRAGLSRGELDAAMRRALARLRRETPGVVPPAPPVYPADDDWRSRLRLARSIRHPTFSTVYYRQAVEASHRLAEDDPRRLWTRFEAARERARSTPGRAEAALDALSGAFAARDGPGGLYQAVVDLERAHIRLAFGRFGEARALAQASQAALLGADREDLLVEAAMILAAAASESRRALDSSDLPAEADAWRAYAYGAPSRSFQRADPARAPVEPQGYAPITLALLLTTAPLALLCWALRRVF